MRSNTLRRRKKSTMNKILLGDAASTIEGLDDESIDLVVTSPPYYNARPEYAEYDSLYEFIQEMIIVFGVLRPKLRPGARVCINTSSGYNRSPYVHIGSQWINAMLRLGYLMRGEIVWDKGASVGSSTAWGCHDESTEVRIRQGWIPFEHLEDSDLVLTYDKANKSWAYIPVRQVIRYEYNGIMYRYNNQRLDFCVTPNHEMIYLSEKSEWQKKPIVELLNLDSFSVPTINNEISSIKYEEIEYCNIERVDYQGLVGCATVDTGILLTRRNKKFLISGNSWISPSSPQLRDVHEMIYVFDYGGHKHAGNKENATISKEEFLEATKSVWKIQTEHSKIHPAIMPYALAERLVNLYSFRGDTVLDPFCGSGTTCIAANNCGRKYIGIDKNEMYADYARTRLSYATS